jgi:hypothetical protein
MSKQRMADSKEFRDKIEERKGSEWYNSASKVGDLHDPHMSRDGETERYSGAEIRAEMRAGRGDMTTEELTKKYEDMYASGQINLNGNAKEFLRDKHGANLVRKGDGGSDDDDLDGGYDDVIENPAVIPIDPTLRPPVAGPKQTITTIPSTDEVDFVPGLSDGGFDFDQTLNVNQDNDISNMIYGSNNNLSNFQDNSISNFANIGDGLYAKRNPMDFKNMFMQNLFN